MRIKTRPQTPFAAASFYLRFQHQRQISIDGIGITILIGFHVADRDTIAILRPRQPLKLTGLLLCTTLTNGALLQIMPSQRHMVYEDRLQLGLMSGAVVFRCG